MGFKAAYACIRESGVLEHKELNEINGSELGTVVQTAVSILIERGLCAKDSTKEIYNVELTLDNAELFHRNGALNNGITLVGFVVTKNGGGTPEPRPKVGNMFQESSKVVSMADFFNRKQKSA